MPSVVVWNGFVKQIRMGLAVGCHICARENPKKKWTRDDFSAHCAGCKEAYCREHASERDVRFCVACRPNGDSKAGSG